MRDVAFINKIVSFIITLIPCFVFAKIPSLFLYSLLFVLLLCAFVLFFYNYKELTYKIYFLRVIFILLSLLFWLLYFNVFINYTKFSTLLKDSDISYIEGVLVSDPIKTEKGGSLFTLKVNKTLNKDKTISCSSQGYIKIYSANYSDKYIQGQSVTFKITGIKEELFFGNPVYSSPTTLLQEARGKTKSWISSRIMSHSSSIKPFISTESRVLSRMLLLGFNDDVKLSLKDNSKEVGLSHIFALSGLHINIIISIFSLVLFKFKNDIKQKILIILLILYLYIVGFSPSLYRAVITYIVSVLFFKYNKDFALVFSLFVQTVLFPYSVVSLSFHFSYVCTVCIVKLNSFIMFCFKRVIPVFFNKILSSGISAIILSSLISIKEFNFWSFYGIIFSYPLCLFVSLSMIGGILNIIFEGSIVSGFILEKSYMVLKFIIDNLSKIKINLSYRSYYIFFIFIFLLFIFKIIFLNKKSPTKLKVRLLKRCI